MTRGGRDGIDPSVRDARRDEGEAASGTAWEVFLIGVPLVWIVVALVHPMGGGDVYDELQDQVGLWLGVHFAQLVLSLGLAMIFWVLLQVGLAPQPRSLVWRCPCGWCPSRRSTR